MDLLEPTPAPVEGEEATPKRAVPAKRKAPSGEDSVGKNVFAKRPKKAAAPVAAISDEPTEAKNESKESKPPVAEPKETVAPKKKVGLPPPSPPKEDPTPSPLPPQEPSMVPSNAPLQDTPSPTVIAMEPPQPPLRVSTRIDATAQPVEEMVQPLKPSSEVLTAAQKERFLPYGSLCDEYAALLIGCINLPAQPEDMTLAQITELADNDMDGGAWTLTKQTRGSARPPNPAPQKAFGFTWYRAFREGPKRIERATVISPSCAEGVLHYNESIAVDTEHANEMRMPFVLAWWRSYAQAKAGGSLVEPLCAIIGGERTGHFTTLISRDGVYYQHHNSLPMNSSDGKTRDASDVLVEKFLLAAHKVVKDLTLTHSKTVEQLRALNIPYVTEMLHPSNRIALETLFAKTTPRFFITYHLDRNRLGPSQMPHQSLRQVEGTNECLLHCVERIAYLLADNGNNVSCTGGPSLAERRAVIKRMRECCIRWWKLKWE